MYINNKINNKTSSTITNQEVKAIDTIIFDFDGTIIDTNRLIEEGLNHFSMKYRGSALTQKELSDMTGKTLEDQMAYINPNKSEMMTEQFKIWYIYNHDAKTWAFPGVKELLDHLKFLGYQLALVSNNSSPTIEHGLRHLGLNDMFEIIISRNDVKTVKPSPEGLNRVMDYFNVDPDQCMYIGDTAGDIMAAKAANMFSVMVGWTHLTQEEILKVEPDWVLNVPNHLFMILNAYILEGTKVAG